MRSCRASAPSDLGDNCRPCAKHVSVPQGLAQSNDPSALLPLYSTGLVVQCLVACPVASAMATGST
jgi:hypothetical protein